MKVRKDGVRKVTKRRRVYGGVRKERRAKSCFRYFVCVEAVFE